MARSVPVNAMAVVFAPFAAGYFVSFFFRNVNAVIAKDLAADFALAPSDLGFLTSLYALTFAACQVPLGVMLDRYGPRRVVAALFLVAASGALVFALARDLAGLSIGRALIGAGVSGALMGAIKAFTLWFPPRRLATVNGLYLAMGGLGALAATAPAEALLGPLGWRGLFAALSVLSLGVAVAIVLVVPEKRLPGEGETLGAQVAELRKVFGSLAFWRLALPFIVCLGAYQTLQGLWLAPWLADVAGLTRAEVGRYLFVTALTFVLGSVVFGAAGDQLAQRGIPRIATYKAGQAVSALMLLVMASGLATVHGVALGAVLAAYGFTLVASTLAYSVLGPLFPLSMTGRVVTVANMMIFVLTFLLQWGVGEVLRHFPQEAGRYAPEGFRWAFAAMALAHLATLAWVWPMRDPSAAGADRPGG